MQATSISWCDTSWNPTFGCSRVSRGCERCYAEVLALRRGWSKYPCPAAVRWVSAEPLLEDLGDHLPLDGW